MTKQSLTLYNIETELLDLVRLREDTTEPEELAAIDTQIAEYVGREVRKVDGIASLLREFERRAEIDRAEAKRISKRAQQWARREARLREMVTSVMEATGQKRIEGQHSSFVLVKKSGIGRGGSAASYRLKVD